MRHLAACVLTMLAASRASAFVSRTLRVHQPRALATPQQVVSMKLKTAIVGLPNVGECRRRATSTWWRRARWMAVRVPRASHRAKPSGVDDGRVGCWRWPRR